MSNRLNSNWVKYKFKSALEYSTANFSGTYISVADLRRQIIQQHRLVQNPDYTLQITNITKEDAKHVYDSDQTLIPAKAHLTIARIPIPTEPVQVASPYQSLSNPNKRKISGDSVQTGSNGDWGQPNYDYNYGEPRYVNYGESYGQTGGPVPTGPAQPMNSNLKEIPLATPPDRRWAYPRRRAHSSAEGGSAEAEASDALTPPLTLGYRGFNCKVAGHWIKDCPDKVKPSSAAEAEPEPATSPNKSQPSPTYRCFKCNTQGHWIKDCPVQQYYGVRAATGIPRSTLVIVDDPNAKGALLTPEGRYAVPSVDFSAYKAEETEAVSASTPYPQPRRKCSKCSGWDHLALNCPVSTSSRSTASQPVNPVIPAFIAPEYDDYEPETITID